MGGFATPAIVIASDAKTFRRLGRERVAAHETVLEVGCSDGRTTRELAKAARRVYAVEHSAEFAARARENLAGLANVEILELDARDVAALHARVPEPDVLFLDVGGTAPLDVVASHLRQLLRVYCLRLVAVRSNELAELAAMIEEVHTPEEECLQRPVPLGFPSGLEPLLDLSRSPVVSNRVFALRRLRERPEREAWERIRELERTDRSASVRRAAKRTLARRTEPERGPG